MCRNFIPSASGPTRRETSNLQSSGERLLSNDLGQPKVGEFHSQIFHPQDVLGLNVAVDDVALMLWRLSVNAARGAVHATYQVLDALEELDEHMSGFVFGQLRSHHNIVEQLAFRCKLQDQIDAIILVKGFLEAEHARVAHSHQNCDFLLQTLRLGPFVDARSTIEHLDGISQTRRFLDAQVHRGKMPFAKLLLQGVLLPKSTGTVTPGVTEGKTSFVNDVDLVCILQLPTLIPTDDGVVDEGAIAGQIFQHGDGISVGMLREDNAVPVRYGWKVDDTVSRISMSPKASTGLKVSYRIPDVGRSDSLQWTRPSCALLRMLPPVYERLKRHP